MGADRPINADVPAPTPPMATPPAKPDTPTQPAAAAKQPPPAKPEPKRKRRQRRSVPGALKLIVSLVMVAIAFIVVAVIGGSGGPKERASGDAPAPAPSPTADGTTTTETPSSQTAEQLGYPAFATGNTTRIGGSDPAANAAAVALAVFPSTSGSQRPAAVTLVGEDDWAGGIAAAVLMAAPLRAPILVASPDALPDPTSEALAALDPQGDSASGGASTFAIGDVATPDGQKVTRINAGSAAAEAAAIAKLRDRLFGSPPAHVVIAPGSRPEIAMPAAAWAARSGNPVLFSGARRLPKPTVEALKRHSGLPVYVLGPSAAISSDVVREIAKIAPRVKRVSGEAAVANAIAFARYGDGDFGWSINDPGHGFILARSDSPLDAAAAAPLSASGTWGPLLLTDSADTLPAELRSYFLDVKPGYTNNPTRAFYNHVWVIGDQEAIDVNQQADVNELAELAKIGGGAP